MMFALVRGNAVVAKGNENVAAVDTVTGMLVAFDTSESAIPDGCRRVVVADVLTSPPNADDIDLGYGNDIVDWTVEPDGSVTRQQRWRPRTIEDARTACEQRRGYHAMIVHSAPVPIALTGLAGLTGVEIDTNPDGSIDVFHTPEDGAVVLMSAMTEKARGVVDDAQVDYGVSYWMSIQAYRTELDDLDMRPFNVFRPIGQDLVKTRIKVRNAEVESRLLAPYRETMPDRQTDYENDIRAFEKASTITEYDALFV